MSKKIVYFIQPVEFLGTNKYKIGMSQKQHFLRVYRGYGVGTKWISINEIRDPYVVEKIMKKTFNDKFERFQGNEYFLGNYEEMLVEYNTIVMPFVLEKFETENGSNIVVMNDENDDIVKNMNTVVVTTNLKKYKIDLNVKYKCPNCIFETNNKRDYTA